MTFSLRPTSSSDLPGEGRLGENLRRFLEARGRDEALALHGRLGDPQELGRPLGRTRLGSLGRLAAVRFDRRVRLLDDGDRNHFARLNSVSPGSVTLTASWIFRLMRRNSNLSTTTPGGVGVADVIDADLAEHLADDELDVLVVDFHALRAVHVLDLTQQVLLDRLFAGDPQDVVRDERAADEGIPAFTRSPVCTIMCLPCGTMCFTSWLFVPCTTMTRLPRFFSCMISTSPSISATTAGSFGLRASKSSVTRGRPPVMSCVSRRFAGFLARAAPAAICWPSIDFQDRPLGDVVEVEDLPRGVFHDDLRMQVPLVLDDDVGGRSRWRRSRCLIVRPSMRSSQTDLTADFGENRNRVRIPLAQDLADLDVVVLPSRRARHRPGSCTSRARGPWSR